LSNLRINLDTGQQHTGKKYKIDMYMYMYIYTCIFVGTLYTGSSIQKSPVVLS